MVNVLFADSQQREKKYVTIGFMQPSLSTPISSKPRKTVKNSKSSSSFRLFGCNV